MTLTALFQSMATLVLLLLGMAAIGDWIRRGNIKHQAGGCNDTSTNTVDHGKEDSQEKGPEEKGRSQKEGSTQKERSQKEERCAREEKATHISRASLEAGREGRPQAQGPATGPPHQSQRKALHRDPQQPRGLNKQGQQPPRSEE